MADPAELEAGIPAELEAGMPAELEGATHPHPQPLPPQLPEDITTIITQLEHQTVEAHTKRDATAFNTYLAPESLSVSAKGVVHDARTGEWQRWKKSPAITNLQVLRVTHDVAIVRYQIKVEDYYRPGWPAKHLRSSTWRREQGGTREWKRVFHQVTSVS